MRLKLPEAYDRANAWAMRHLTLVAVAWGLGWFLYFISGRTPLWLAIATSVLAVVLLRWRYAPK